MTGTNQEVDFKTPALEASESQIERESLSKTATVTELQQDLPRGELWEVSSQLGRLRREAQTISMLRRDRVDENVEGVGKRISSSMLWSAQSFQL